MSNGNDQTNSKGVLQKPGGHLHDGQHINSSAAEKAAAENAKTNQSPIPPAPKAPGPVGISTGADNKDEVELCHQGLIDVDGGHNALQGQQEPATDKDGGGHLHDGQHINFSAAEKAVAENANTNQKAAVVQSGGEEGAQTELKHQLEQLKEEMEQLKVENEQLRKKVEHLENAGTSIPDVPATVQSIATLPSLPPELLTFIVSYLDVRSRFRFAAVCTVLQGVVSHPSVWNDVTRISLVSQKSWTLLESDDLEETSTMKVNGYSFDTLANVERAMVILLKYTRPKKLVIHGCWEYGGLHEMMGRLAASLPDSIDNLLLHLLYLSEHCSTLLDALSSSLQTIRLQIPYSGSSDTPYSHSLGLGAHFHKLEVIACRSCFAVRLDVALSGFQQLPKLRVIQLPENQHDRQQNVRELMAMWNDTVSPPSIMCTGALLQTVDHLRLMNARARNAIVSVCANDYEAEVARQLPQLFPNLRRVCFTAIDTLNVLGGLREAFFLQHAGATEQTTLTVVVLEEIDVPESQEDGQQTPWLRQLTWHRGSVTVNVTYPPPDDDCSCLLD